MRKGAAKLGWFEFQAEGLSLEKLINQCTEKGVKLRGVKKVTARQVKGQVAAKDLEKLREIAEARGWRLTVGRARGAVQVFLRVRARALLVAGVLAFFALCGGLLSCVWFIDVRGAGPYTGEVERILAAHDVRVGRFGFMMDVAAIKSDMESQLTGLSWVGVQVRGVRLVISCVQASAANPTPVAAGDIVAVRDGIIESIAVTAGTAVVRPGDAVRKGQLLVRGEERAWDGATNQVRAQAEIMARVWYSAEAKVSGTMLRTLPTGRSSIEKTLCVPGYELSLSAPPEYDDYDTETSLLPVAGSLPVWVRLTTYEEVIREEISRDEETVQEEAGLAAMRLAQEKIGQDTRVVDKWVEYSMINDGGYRAIAVIEALEEITDTVESGPRMLQ